MEQINRKAFNKIFEDYNIKYNIRYLQILAIILPLIFLINILQNVFGLHKINPLINQVNYTTFGVSIIISVLYIIFTRVLKDQNYNICRIINMFFVVLCFSLIVVQTIISFTNSQTTIAFTIGLISISVIYREEKPILFILLILSGILMSTGIIFRMFIFKNPASNLYILLPEVIIITLISIIIVLVTEKIHKNLLSYKLKAENYIKDIKVISTKDKLTGLNNRKQIEYILEMEYKRAMRYSSIFSVILLDIDHFHEINDKFEYKTGDIVLHDFSNILRNEAREEDIIGRFGEEEFMIILLEADAEQARELAKRIQSRASDYNINGEKCKISFSAGIAGFEVSKSHHHLIKTVNEKLRKAKKQGGNNIVL